MSEQNKIKYQEAREFMKSRGWGEALVAKGDEVAQPPVYKEADPSLDLINLPRNFDDLDFKGDLFSLLQTRRSQRVFSEETLSLLELSFLLWAAQGIRTIRGRNNFATFRPVPSAGARHAFETYIDVINVEGLEPGIYHYVAGSHSLQKIAEQTEERRLASVEGQQWVMKAGVIFYFSFVAYRMEWLYGKCSHKVGLIDVGHVGQNLYLACESLKLGTCGLGALNQDVCDESLGLDGVEEYTIYAHPVGRINEDRLGKPMIFQDEE